MSFVQSFIRRFGLESRIRLFLFPMVLGWIFTTWVLIIQNYLVWQSDHHNVIADSGTNLARSLGEIKTEIESWSNGVKRENSPKQLVFEQKLAAFDALIKKQTSEALVTAHRAREISKWIIVFSIAIVVCFGTVIAGFAWYIVHDVASQLGLVSKELAGTTSVTTSSAQEVADSSSSLSSGVTQQAAALQETVASLEEVRAMVSKNADNAQKAQSVAVESTHASQKGKDTVTEMITAMGEIHRGNEAIEGQVETSNNELTEITKVIYEIASKTKIINDIVFQTKLLSFNASVEAARAGEHGKGFAVVAEEVGNLAQMSGQAAKEIAQMVDGSIKKVDKIIKDTKSKVGNLITMGKEKVDAGITTARRCNDVLDSILKNVEDMNQMIGEMATSSSEQAKGVDEISKAMNQVEVVTQGNSTAAGQSTVIAHQLNDQAIKLESHVRMLGEITRGTKGVVHHESVHEVSNGNHEHVHDTAKVLPMVSPTLSGVRKEMKMPGVSYKQAIGAENPPSENDPRFKDV